MRKSTLECAQRRFKVLSDIALGHSPVTAELQKACESQPDFAAFKSTALGISRISLNQLKVAADKALKEQGGWKKLNELRKATRDYQLESEQPKATTREAKAVDKLGEAIRYRLRLGRAFIELLDLAERFTGQDPSLKSELEHFKKLWFEEVSGCQIESTDGK